MKKYNPPHKLTPKTPAQADYLAALQNEMMTIATGPPGTGKTFMAINNAVARIRDKSIKQIVLARPAEGPCKSLGFEPGTLNEKLQGWMMPFYDSLEGVLGKGELESRIGSSIHFQALHQIMGRSFHNSYIIVDEAQNLNIETAKSLVTRVGKYCKVVLCGDIRQQTIKSNSGLKFLLDLVHKYDLPVNTIEFTIDDCVRGPITKMWLEAFEDEGLI